MIEEIADCSQPCIKNTQHIFNPLAVSSRIFSPERRPEHLQFQLPLKKLTYSSRHENQASKFLLKLGPPFSEPCMELNPLIGKRLKQSSWDQQKQHQTTKIQSCLPISVSECVSGTVGPTNVAWVESPAATVFLTFSLQNFIWVHVGG